MTTGSDTGTPSKKSDRLFALSQPTGDDKKNPPGLDHSSTDGARICGAKYLRPLCPYKGTGHSRIKLRFPWLVAKSRHTHKELPFERYFVVSGCNKYALRRNQVRKELTILLGIIVLGWIICINKVRVKQDARMTLAVKGMGKF
jgi:hypothetical protein